MSDAFSQLTRLCQDFQYEYFLLGHPPEQDANAEQRNVILTNLPPYLVEDLVTANLLSEWPVIETYNLSVAPFGWSVDQRTQSGTISGSTFSISEVDRLLGHEIGATGGHCLPLATSGHRRTFLILLNTNQSKKRLKPEAFFAAQNLFANIEGILERRNQSTANGLNQRELECLSWAAAGKTSGEIASIVELSEHTVNHYLNSCCKKLNCVNRTQAVANAIRQRLIR